MSFDLFIFDPKKTPQDDESFLDWFAQIVQWEDKQNYSCPSNLTPPLQAFFRKLSVRFPPMNTSLGVPEQKHNSGRFVARFIRWYHVKQDTLSRPLEVEDDFDEARLTDYTFANTALYMAFSWSVVDDALHSVIDAAIKTHVGFYFVSTSDGVILSTPGQLEKFKAQLRKPAKQTVSKLDIFQLLSNSGWDVKRCKDDGSRYALYQQEGRTIQVSPHISNSCRRTRLSWNEGICSQRFAKAASIIYDKAYDYYPMHLAGRGTVLDKATLNLDEVKQSLNEVIETAMETDLDALLNEVLELPKTAPGNAPIRLLSAMACSGDFFDLIEMRDAMKSGNRMGFVPYVQLEHLERALDAWRKLSDAS